MRRLVPSLFLATLSIGFVLGALEAALRVAPEALLPRGSFGAGRFDREIGLGVHAGPAFYNSVRFVEKRPNSRGWMDREHDVAKPPGTLRVGFFGDSYVEALQVPTEVAFFRQLPERIGDVTVESLGFGMSGWGTLHAFRAARSEAERFDLDLVVYVFVENDPGDNAWSISGGPRPMPTPYAELADEAPGYAERWTRDPEDTPLWQATLKALQQRLRIAQLVWSRVSLLRQARPGPPPAGPAAPTPPGEATPPPMDSSMRGRTPPGAKPRAIDVPSSWPGAYREEAATLTRRILADWRRHAESHGRELVILYVPRGGAHLRDELASGESWRPWLIDTARSLGIEVIDPLDALRGRARRGEAMFDDHFSPAGHAAVAQILAEALATRVARMAASEKAASDKAAASEAR